jgi:signal transduction histidine kinase
VIRAQARSVRRRLTIWLALSGMASLVAFAAVTAAVIHFDERNEHLELTEGDHRFEAARQALTAMAVAAPVGLVLASAFAFFLTRRALAPVEAVIRSAGEMSGADLTKRLPMPADPGAREELRPVVDAFNGLLDRIEEASTATRRFAAEASHELRTPLAVIAGSIEVELRHPRTRDEWESTAKDVLEEIRRLSSLVDALLKLARAEAASGFTPVDLRAVVEKAVASCRPIAASRPVTLDLVAGSVGAKDLVVGDPLTLGSAFRNLLSNAIEHSPERGAVRVVLERAGEQLAVHVDDSGPGLDPPGRARPNGGETREGAGLGLSIARRIVQTHGGSITTGRSVLGGARFTITLPGAAA